jgi:LysM repeat protein
MMRSLTLWAAVAAAVCALSGCTGPMFEGSIFDPQARSVPDPQVARVATESQQNGIAVQQISEQIEALNRSQAQLEQRLARIEAAQTQARPAAGSDDIEAIRRDVQSLRAQQDNMRRDITTDLTSRIEKIAGRQQPAAPAYTPPSATPPSVKPQAAGSQPARSGYEHKVERGQTLTEIARGYGVSVQSIMKANKISNPSAIRVGQTLFIPDAK